MEKCSVTGIPVRVIGAPVITHEVVQALARMYLAWEKGPVRRDGPGRERPAPGDVELLHLQKLPGRKDAGDLPEQPFLVVAESIRGVVRSAT